jgi:hypothetical protein
MNIGRAAKPLSDLRFDCRLKRRTLVCQSWIIIQDGLFPSLLEHCKWHYFCYCLLHVALFAACGTTSISSCCMCYCLLRVALFAACLTNSCLCYYLLHVALFAASATNCCMCCLWRNGVMNTGNCLAVFGGGGLVLRRGCVWCNDVINNGCLVTFLRAD